MFDFLVRPFRKKTDGDDRYYRIIKDVFGFRPGNIELYKLALIHRSASVSMPDGAAANNERLEFLGDAVLESIVSDYLFIEFPQSDEGFLTQLRSKIVSRSTLNDLCVKIGLADHIISQAAKYVQKHIHGDAFEAMIGAIYLDKGYDFVNRLIINDLFVRYLDLESMNATETDYKSRLIEWCQKNRHTIRFDTRPADDSDSHNPKFIAVAVIDGMEMGYGFGATKKEAEQHAAFSVSQFTSEDFGSNYLDLLDRIVMDKGESASDNAPARKAEATKIPTYKGEPGDGSSSLGQDADVAKGGPGQRSVREYVSQAANGKAEASQAKGVKAAPATPEQAVADTKKTPVRKSSAKNTPEKSSASVTSEKRSSAKVSGTKRPSAKPAVPAKEGSAAKEPEGNDR